MTSQKYFFQIDNEVVLSDLSDGAFRLYAAMKCFAKSEMTVEFCKKSYASRLKKCRKKVARDMRELEDRGLVKQVSAPHRAAASFKILPVIKGVVGCMAPQKQPLEGRETPQNPTTQAQGMGLAAPRSGAYDPTLWGERPLVVGRGTPPYNTRRTNTKLEWGRSPHTVRGVAVI